MTKRPLRKHEFEQIGDAQRPRQVAPARRSGLRERPRWVAARGRCERSLRERFRVSENQNGERLLPVALVRSLQASGATSARRSGRSLRVALDESLRDVVHSDLMPSLREVAPGSARPKTTLITSFELQMHPNVSRNSMWYSNT
ncbi:hypothetical protein IGI04_034737 [Brassica rapa subsp. trilocularis]|uniref:Uncharacterized protein n=1 Tax=Brassica rapa subsp. trilocularis TaxID=1813537 RepID=A0ABQ7L9L1_BRACM|nr:hypothetical protein IGI04_034737 [Brassica rapa subsp. trilocularis]